MSFTARRRPTTFSVSREGKWAHQAYWQIQTTYYTVRVPSFHANSLRHEFARARILAIQTLMHDFKRQKKKNGWRKWKRGFGKPGIAKDPGYAF